MRFAASFRIFLYLLGTVTAGAQEASRPPARIAGPEHIDANSSANAGRKQLTDYLNNLAYKQTAARRETIAGINTRAQAEARQRHVRATILGLLGSLPTRTPLNVRTTGSKQQDGFRIDKVMFDSQPNFPVTALLYLPSGTGRFPAIIMAPGHGPSGKVGDIAMATAFARAGFVVLSYDPIGQGERLQYLDPKSPPDKPTSLASRPTGEHGEAGLQPTLIGDALARYFLWDGMRAVDYLAALPQVDAQRIGAFGCSGGGTMTALLGALDPRIAATGVACFTTSFDALLPSATGVQDSEQSTPNFIASGLDFPDWVELAAPRPYAIIATTEDMFPFAGVLTTEAESRRFYKLFNADSDLTLIKGPGGHGNLRPILPQILAFFADHLHPDAAFAKNLPPVTDPFDAKANPPRKPGDRAAFPPPPPPSLWQVTPTGQLSSSFPGTATIHTLNLLRATALLHHTSKLKPESSRKRLSQLQADIRAVTHAGEQRVVDEKIVESPSNTLGSGGSTLSHVPFYPEHGIVLSAKLAVPDRGGRHPAVLVVGDLMLQETDRITPTESALMKYTSPERLIMAIQPRPAPSGTEETKSPILGDFYLTGLRAQLVGKTLIGMRVDDILRAVDYLASRADVDPDNITAEASGHLGLVLLHAAVLDPRLKHITVTGVLRSYGALLDAPLPVDAPQDMLPGVLLRYDIPDLIRALGPRLTWSNPTYGGGTAPPGPIPTLSPPGR